MEEENTVCIKCRIPNTHSFIYKGKEYPIKYDFFKYHSKYFLENQDMLQQNKTIQLINEETEGHLNLSDESIQNFINFVQCQKIQINNENVAMLNFLSRKYEVPELFEVTNKYISNHHHELILQNLLIYQDDLIFDTSTYEDILSSNLIDYLQNDLLLSLNVQVLYRVMTKYQLKYKNIKNTKENKEIIDFLFKYLDKHGIETSILFNDVDFGDSRIEYFNRLLNDYSSKFDFHYINSSIVKSLYEVNNELVKMTEKCQIEQEKLIQLFNSEIEKVKTIQKENENLMLSEIQKMKNEKIDEMKKEEKMAEIIQKMKNEIDEIKLQKKKEEEEIEKMKKEKIDEIHEFGVSFDAKKFFKLHFDEIKLQKKKKKKSKK